MAVFKFVINDSKNKRSKQIEVDQSKAAGLVGKKIGEQFNGDILDLSGYVFEITGGTDKDGFPMYPGLQGSGRKKMLLVGKPGFKPWIAGQRKRKTVRGNTISDAIVQINAKIVKVGEKPLDQAVPGKDAPKKEEAAPEKVEDNKEEPVEEAKPEAAEEQPKEDNPEEKKEQSEEKTEEKAEPEEKPVETPEKPEEKEAESKEETGGVESKDEN